MNNIDENIREGVKKLAKLLPEKYKIGEERDYELRPMVWYWLVYQGDNTPISWCENYLNGSVEKINPFIDSSLLDQMLANEGMWYYIFQGDNYAWSWQIEDYDDNSFRPFDTYECREPKEIPDIKQLLIKEVFVEFVKIIEKQKEEDEV